MGSKMGLRRDTSIDVFAQGGGSPCDSYPVGLIGEGVVDIAGSVAVSRRVSVRRVII
ncbi:MAG: hypothetical protein WD532_09990 [Acidimicrobiia bacterium]